MTAGARVLALALATLAAACASRLDPGDVVGRGTVEAREVTVRSEAGGRVVAVRFEEGKRVSEGEEIVRLDRDELDARARVAEASRDAVLARLALLRDGARPQEAAESRSAVDKARAALKRAEDARQRATQLFAVGSMSEEKRQEAEASARIARDELAAVEQRLSLVLAGPREHEVQGLEANLREAEAQVNLLGVQAARTSIKAPFAGTVTRKSVEVGEVITPGTSLCTVTDLGDLRVKVYLSEQQLAGVSVDQAVTIRPEAAAGKTAAGRVLSIASAAEFLPRDVETPEDRAFQVFAVKVAVGDPIPEIKPGMNVAVTFARDKQGT